MSMRHHVGLFLIGVSVSLAESARAWDCGDVEHRDPLQLRPADPAVTEGYAGVQALVMIQNGQSNDVRLCIEHLPPSVSDSAVAFDERACVAFAGKAFEK